MSAFDLKAFTARLIAESLFYDIEYGAIGNVSLISESESKERFIAYYLPEEQNFVIDEVTAWEKDDVEAEAGVGYALATDSNELMASESQDEIARKLLKLAEDNQLLPSVSLFFEDEE